MSESIALVGVPPEGQCALVAAVAVRSGLTQLLAQRPRRRMTLTAVAGEAGDRVTKSSIQPSAAVNQANRTGPGAGMG